MHWTELNAAKAELGKALRRQGWKLFGWKEDKSDSMTDYYDPEHWDGIATLGDFVAVVDGGPCGDMSGKDEIRLRPTTGERCPRCHGKKIDPSGWTLGEALRTPELFHKEVDRIEFGEDAKTVTLLPRVVKIRLFADGGILKCRKCKGTGTMRGTPEDVVAWTWPTYQKNPARRLWHVERGGVILASGIGLKKCQDARWKSENPAADALAAKMTKAANCAPLAWKGGELWTGTA